MSQANFPNFVLNPNGTLGSFESYLQNDIEGSSLSITPTLISWMETITVFGYDKDGNDLGNNLFMLLDAYNKLATGANSTLAPLVRVGDPHHSGNGAYAQSVDLSPRTSDSTVNIRQSIRYIMPGAFAEVSYETYQQTEVRTFAEDPTGWLDGAGNDTRLTVISFAPQSQIGRIMVAATNTNVPVVSRVNVPCITRAMRITQYELLSTADNGPSINSGAHRPVWNAKAVWGFPAGALLYMGRQAQTDGTPIHRCTYTFLINQYGWHHFYGVYTAQNGLIPYVITPIDPTKVTPQQATVPMPGAAGAGGIFGTAMGAPNGTAAWRMLPSVDFSALFTNLKPPFNKNGVPLPAAVAAPDLSSVGAIPSSDPSMPIPTDIFSGSLPPITTVGFPQPPIGL